MKKSPVYPKNDNNGNEFNPHAEFSQVMMTRD